jgi:hypothetical protein
MTLQAAYLKDQCEELQSKIDSITRCNSKHYFRKALKRLATVSPENANVICNYISAEQTDFNIKDHPTGSNPDSWLFVSLTYSTFGRLAIDLGGGSTALLSIAIAGVVITARAKFGLKINLIQK